jgi:hypothetical protein
MKLMPWGVVLAGISLVSCHGRQQALPPDVAKRMLTTKHRCASEHRIA